MHTLRFLEKLESSAQNENWIVFKAWSFKTKNSEHKAFPNFSKVCKCHTEKSIELNSWLVQTKFEKSQGDMKWSTIKSSRNFCLFQLKSCVPFSQLNVLNVCWFPFWSVWRWRWWILHCTITSWSLHS